jgi:imidazolonepropionase-like amidohydrolase
MAMGRDDIGTIEVGKKANLVLLKHANVAEAFYDWSTNPVERVWFNG